jgi:large subunit ribosomal protein L18e
MISKTKINKKIGRKKNQILVETLKLANKNNQLELARKLSRPTKLQKKINLEDLNKLEEEKVLVSGKVLGSGNINREIHIAALSFSDSAREKLKNAGCEINSIKDILEKNKNLEGVKVI